MKNAFWLVALVVSSTGCPDPTGNPDVLWLQPSNGEQNVKLGDVEPHPY